MSSFDKDTSQEIITDLNDELTLGSQHAAYDRHGLTQYRLKDSTNNDKSIQSLEYCISFKENDKRRQMKVDAKN